MKGLCCAVLFLALSSPLAFPQSIETGSIIGTVRSPDGKPLPGVTVTVSSPRLIGARSSVTDARGKYRFPALPPGTYRAEAALQGYSAIVRENIRLTTTGRFAVDFTMKPQDLEEGTTVLFQAPTVDFTSTETAPLTLSAEILRNIPYSQWTPELVNLAPGVSADAAVAYGAQDGTGINYSMDGVNIADPERGMSWVLLDHNIIEEAKIMAAGLPAEYGNFTGVIFNVVTKSGGNEITGHFEFDFQGTKDIRPYDFWQQDNNQKYLKDFPDLRPPRTKFWDANVQLGGPLLKDTVWFFQGFQFQRFEDYATGFIEPQAHNLPRSFTKITARLASETHMAFSLEVDAYDGKNVGADATTAPEAVASQKSPEFIGNFSLTHIFNSETFVDIRAAYFWGRYHLEPESGRETYARFDIDRNMLLENSGYYYLADRTRLQANVGLTHYVEDFITGNHDFKFGVEVEHATCRSQYGFTGSGGPLGNYVSYVDNWGYNQYFGYNTGNYLAYQYQGYDFDSPYTRVEGFAQDSWQVTALLNINAGIRYSQNWGSIKDQGSVWNTHRVAPRVGFTLDIFGDASTVLKAHFGQFTEGMLAAYHNRLSMKWFDYVSYYWNLEAQEWVEFERIRQNWKLQDGIKHPYMNQLTLSLERELFPDASVSVSYIRRDWKNIIGVYDTEAVYEKIDYFVSPLKQTFQIWRLVSGDAHEFQIENIEKGPDRPYYLGDAYRFYEGWELFLNKRFSNRWQLLLSYIYSKTKGTIDNGWGDDIGWNSRNGQQAGDPNYWINAEGNATVDPTHMLKVQGTYVLPLDVHVSVYFRAISGQTWAQRFRTRILPQGRVTFYTEPRGSYRYPMQKNLDVRLEKTFSLARKYRLGIMIDVFNVFNSDVITSWGTRIGYDWIDDPGYPGYPDSTEGHDLYGLVKPRQVRLGIRLIF